MNNQTLFLQSNSLAIIIVSQKYQDLLQPNSHDRFSKIWRTFYASRKLWIYTHAERKITNLSDFNTLLLHIPLFALTHKQNYRETDRITEKQTELRRNKYTCFAWAGGTFFPVVLLCQFFVLREIGFGFTYYLCT